MIPLRTIETGGFTMSAFDYKKEYKSLYYPGQTPAVVTVPPARFVAVEGKGNPNEPDGAYSRALAVLYSISYTIKMSYKGSHAIEGFFEYVVPPLEGFWWMGDGRPGVDYSDKSGFQWVSVIRLPEFVSPQAFAWAREEAARKKKIDTACAQLLEIDEGLCVQCMHIGPYDDEPATVAKMEQYLQENGYQQDFSDTRRHHEIYLGDPRKTAPEKLKTVIRHPVAKM